MRTPIDGLSPGQRRVVDAFCYQGSKATYASVAKALSLHIGTVRRHLMDIRASNPDAYACFRGLRREQLALRHERAEKARKRHTRAFFWRRQQREAMLDYAVQQIRKAGIFHYTPKRGIYTPTSEDT